MSVSERVSVGEYCTSTASLFDNQSVVAKQIEDLTDTCSVEGYMLDTQVKKTTSLKQDMGVGTSAT
jgi:hypothetical protein